MMRFELTVHATVGSAEEMEELEKEVYKISGRPIGMNYETLGVSFKDIVPPTMAGMLLNLFEAIPGHDINMKTIS